MKTLALSNYQPNFNDPRVIKKCGNVMNWCKTHLNSKHSKHISSRVLSKVFGPSCNDLSKWLRVNLLFQVGSYEVGGECYSYILNKDGLDKISSLIEQNFKPEEERQKKRRKNKLAAATAIMLNTSVTFSDKYEKYVNEMTFQKDFTYKEIDNRFYHELQNIQRDYKTDFWKGHLPYDYDIEACAPTLLAQYAEQCGLIHLLNATLRDYLEHKDEFRNYLADLLDIDVQVAKELINALFNGAKISNNKVYQCSIFKMLDLNEDKLLLLKNDKKIKELRLNIKHMWDRIKVIEKGRGTSWSKGDKWNIYFKLERNVMDVIYDELQKQNIFFFKEHDGFRTNNEIDIDFVEKAITEKTGYKIIIKRKI